MHPKTNTPENKILTTELIRDELHQVWQSVIDGKLSVAQFKEINNCAGKMINSAKVQLEAYAMRKEKPVLKFLAGPV